jgi:hypothetical protein
MRRFVSVAVVGLIVFGFAAAVHADLDAFLSDLNVQAQADLPGFKVKLSTQFGVPIPTVETIIAQVRLPGDAFLCLQLGQMARKPPERVVQTYQRSHGKGWGVIAKELGIKPGSPEFHALKRGDFTFTGEPSGTSWDTGKGKGKTKGKEKGQPG